MKKLYEQLMEYESRDIYPFHMPGHKRNREKMEGFFPVGQDITEITDFDDLHHPEGVIKDAEERAARLFGARESWFCVNGSTGAILAAISAAVPRNGKILIARNCHKSVYHGIYLRNLSVGYVYPKTNRKMGINGGISPEDVEKYLLNNSDVKAVMVTSPTYDGVVSDIKRIAEIVHGYGIPLIVDEAHGAHFSFSKQFPESAVQEGADLVIHSVHKTLPSMTQTALLHRCSDRVNRELIQRFMGIYQSSSPSYILMGSMDHCIISIEKNGKKWFQEYLENLNNAICRLSKNVYFPLLVPKKDEGTAIYGFDPSKILISVKNSEMTGPELHRILHEKYGLEMEMSAVNYVLALSSVGDTKEGLNRLCEAMEDLEKREAEKQKDGEIFYKTGMKEREWVDFADKTEENENLSSMENPAVMRKIADAMDEEFEICTLEQSIGRISSEFGYLYPPGIPLIVPGERISAELVRSVERYLNMGMNFTGFSDPSNKSIHVVREKIWE